MIKQLLIYAFCLQFILTFVSCGNGRNNRNRSNYSETDQYDNSDNAKRSSNGSSSVEPDSQQIKLDLAGKTIVEPTHGLYRGEFKINSASNVINVDIQSTKQKDNQTIYQTRLTLSDDINTYSADVNITYVSNNHEWTFQYLECKYLDIVPTGNFRSCIVVKKEFYGFSEHLYLYNNCDVALVVEGRILSWSSDGMKREWRNFAIEVPANGKSDFYYETDVDYKIERIERP